MNEGDSAEAGDEGKDSRFCVDVFLGQVVLEQRFVPTGPGSYEAQGRSKRYDLQGALVSTTPWSGLSVISNVPEHLAPLLASIPSSDASAK